MKKMKGSSQEKRAKKSAPKTVTTATTLEPGSKDQAGKEETSASESKTQSPQEADSVGATSAPKALVVDDEPQLPATHGILGVFGGPKDRGIKPDDKLALPTGPHGVYERIRSLNPKSFYCAMRWNYHVEHLTPEEVKRWWANKKLLVTNPKNGSAVTVRAVDYGPHENSGLDVSLSPAAAEALGVEIGDEVDIALADPKSPLGKQR